MYVLLLQACVHLGMVELIDAFLLVVPLVELVPLLGSCNTLE